ncbi:hypothetical protein [Natronoglomus mannanivorans]|uniref:Peptidase family M23 n=1 Tax=Natronoglomus mannanivorans TaxID=2979990 RepID=A0AAP2YXB4_9EURY|nr:hypothetical protein [Halobacteria archaeon AArc-xg1-1]
MPKHARPRVVMMADGKRVDGGPTEDCLGTDHGNGVTLEASILNRYDRFSLYNSPYPAHDEGCAIDLYPSDDGDVAPAPAPVSGTVLETKTVRAPPKPYAPEHDHLLLIECSAPASIAGLVARILHVDPVVEPGETVTIGDPLGTLVHAGFFAPWVDDHLHVGFRRPEQNHHRAVGSLPVELAVDVRPLAWDGCGTVVETGETYAVLDSPAHPNPGEFAGIAADGGGVLDGGLAHYDGGGLLGGGDSADGPMAVALNGERIGTATGRTVAWDDVVVTANGEPITGISLFCARDADFGAKLVCPERSLECGQDVQVRVRTGSEEMESALE